jgi:hypothetical protein
LKLAAIASKAIRASPASSPKGGAGPFNRIRVYIFCIGRGEWYREFDPTIERLQAAAYSLAGEVENGGEGGIRTHDTVARMPHFECGAFDHSATSPLEHDDALVSAGCLIAMKLRTGKGPISREAKLLS